MFLLQLISDAGTFAQLNLVIGFLAGLFAMAALIVGLTIPKTSRALVLVMLGVGIVPLLLAAVGVYTGYQTAAQALATTTVAEQAQLWPSALTELYTGAMTGPMAAIWPMSLGATLALAPRPGTRKRLAGWIPALLAGLAGFLIFFSAASVFLTYAMQQFFISVIDAPEELAEALARLDVKMWMARMGVLAGVLIGAFGLAVRRRASPRNEIAEG